MRSQMLFGLLALCLLFLHAVGSAQDVMVPSIAGGPTDLRAFVRFVNLLEDGTPIDFLLDRDNIYRNLSAGQASGYLAIFTSHTYRLAIRPVSSPAVLPTPITDVMLYPRYWYTIIVHGTAQAPAVMLLGDDPQAPRSGNNRIRLVNLVRNAPPLFLSAGSTPVFRGIAYGTVSADALVARNVTTFSIQTEQGPPAFSFTLPPARSRSFTLVAYGNANLGNMRLGIIADDFR